MIQIKNSRKVINNIVLGMMWLAIPLILLGSILLFLELLESKVSIIKQLISGFAIIMMLIFVFILIISLIKYRKEILLNDNERKEKWRFLRKDYRNLWRKMIIFGGVFNIFMIISGIFLLFNPDSDKFNGIFMTIVGLGLLVSSYRQIRELKKMERKVGCINESN